MKLPDKWYNALKWICLIVVPAFVVLLNTLGTIWGFDAEKITLTISALALFVGTIIGVSSANYYKDKNGGEG